jgi:hypothetical protein
LIVDLLHLLDVSQQLLQRLLEIKARYASAQCQLAVLEIPSDFAENERIGAVRKSALNGPANLLLSGTLAYR